MNRVHPVGSKLLYLKYVDLIINIASTHCIVKIFVLDIKSLFF